MTRSVTGLPDPREGEWPEPAEWCFTHKQRRDSCGPCHQDEIDDANAERELTATESADALGRFFRDKLDQINQREDETKGAALAARFERTR